MPKITSVEPQLKNPQRFNIFFDGKFSFGADQDLIVEHRLIAGKEYPQEAVEKLIWEAEVGKLIERVMALFDIRLRTEKEVRDYLRTLSFKRKIKDRDEISEQSIDLVIDKLKQKRLINDTEFAKSWIESRSKKKGLNVIKTELYKKGVSRDVIEGLLTEAPPSNQEQVASSLLEKRLQRWRALPIVTQKRKAYEFLMRRGFSYDLTKEVVEKFIKTEYTSS